MALVEGTNAYVTVEAANNYFADRLDVAAWTEADDIMRGQAIVTATQVLDDLSWTGTAVSVSQDLAFPRIGTYFDPRVGCSIYMDGTEVPKRIRTATYELAYHLLNNDGLLDDTGRVHDLELGPISLKNVITPNLVPASVKRVIKPLLVNQGSNSWWRAN